MKKYTWKEKFQYRFDNMMSRGTISLIGILFGITLLVVVLAGLLVGLVDSDHGMNIGKSVWLSLMHAIDAGTLAGDDGNWLFIFLMTIVTICGLFITSMLIGILNTGIEDKMTALRKGKSIVLENNHIVLLGFNENTLNILSELIIANENQKNEVVVVMDDMDKTEMEDQIHHRIPDTKTTRIICRSGCVDKFSDLAICSLETCRSIILNISQDALTIKAILACVNLLEKSDNNNAYVTAIICDECNMEAAKIAGGNRAEILYFKRTIARLMAHSSRQPGISTVFTNLLGYEGDEIYVEHIEGAEGQTVAQLNRRFSKSTVIGIVHNGEPKVNPLQDTIVQQGDEIILIEEDDGVSVLQTGSAEIDQNAFAEMGEVEAIPQTSLILGRGALLELVLEELDGYVAPGSVAIAANTDWEEDEILSESIHTKNLKVQQKTCDIFSREILEELLSSNPENVLILTDGHYDDEEADARTLMLLLQLHNLSVEKNMHFTVTSEIRNVQNQELARVTKVNDFVVSSNITALMMTQISQNRQQRAILEDLLDEDGSEFYRKPITHYVKCGIPVDFYTITESAARYGEVAIGYQIAKDGRMQTICNPVKAEKITFTENDSLIVIAED